MKENRPCFCFIIVCLAILVLPALVRAQGDDFGGFIGGIPSWNQNQLPTPVPGTDYTAGYAYGPQQLQNRKGDTIVMDVVMDWYGLGPLSMSPEASSQTGMHWTGPNTRAGSWTHSPFGFWCLRCEFQFQAGDDNVSIWLDFIGSDRFGAHLEVKQIIPAPLFSVLSDPDKGTANGIANFLFAAGGVLVGVANFTPDLTAAGIMNSLGWAAGLFAIHYREIAKDPWDGDYCSETPFSLNQQTVDDMEWVRDIDSSGVLVDATEYIDAYGTQAETAANRALSAQQAGDMDCFWNRRWEFIQAMHHMGDSMWNFTWGARYDVGGLDSSVDEQLGGINWSAQWAEGLQ